MYKRQGADRLNENAPAAVDLARLGIEAHLTRHFLDVLTGDIIVDHGDDRGTLFLDRIFGVNNRLRTSLAACIYNRCHTDELRCV